VVRRPIAGRLVIATHNPGKLAEMRQLLAPYGIDAISAGELELTEPDETAMTFRDNARIKAQAAAAATGLPTFADDSGLAVDALDGAPGIHSARWAGSDKNFFRAMETIEDKLRERAGAPQGAFRLGALCRLAGRPYRRIRGTRRRHAALAAARRQGFWLRSDVFA
jgi:XTP/dITP diphosphohydrolase